MRQKNRQTWRINNITDCILKQSDANIAKAQEELNKNFLTETQRVDFENKADISRKNKVFEKKKIR